MDKRIELTDELLSSGILPGKSVVEKACREMMLDAAGKEESRKFYTVTDEPFDSTKTKKTDWIQTFTGKRFYPLEPDIEDIHIVDIAKALSQICRFNGHCTRFYSVAEHSLSCLGLARHMGLSYSHRYAALMHDAAEAYLSDVVRPVKRFITGYSEYEERLEIMIADKYKIQAHQEPVIKKIDNIMLATERRDLFHDPLPWGNLIEEPTDFFDVSKPISHGAINVMQAFLGEFYNLRKALRLPCENEDL